MPIALGRLLGRPVAVRLDLEGQAGLQVLLVKAFMEVLRRLSLSNLLILGRRGQHQIRCLVMRLHSVPLRVRILLRRLLRFIHIQYRNIVFIVLSFQL